jgi:hypothetical protein
MPLLSGTEGLPPQAYRRHPARRLRDAGRFVDAIIDAANRL